MLLENICYYHFSRLAEESCISTADLAKTKAANTISGNGIKEENWKNMGGGKSTLEDPFYA